MNTQLEVIKRLRQETGAGIMECRKALEEDGRTYEQARDYLREKAALQAKQAAQREAREGRIEVYLHGDGRIGVMVEINTQTEFASRSQVVRHLAHEIALQVASQAPRYVRDEDIPPQELEALRQAAAEKARAAGKPERIMAQIVDGAVEKFKNRQVLLRQAYIRDETITITQLLNQAISQTGEKIVIKRFVRWEITPDGEAAEAT